VPIALLRDGERVLLGLAPHCTPEPCARIIGIGRSMCAAPVTAPTDIGVATHPPHPAKTRLPNRNRATIAHSGLHGPTRRRNCRAGLTGSIWADRSPCLGRTRDSVAAQSRSRWRVTRCRFMARIHEYPSRRARGPTTMTRTSYAWPRSFHPRTRLTRLRLARMCAPAGTLLMTANC